MTREKEFYEQFYWPNLCGEYNKVFHVPIFNAKNTEMNAFDTHAPANKYVQYDKNNCSLSSLDYAVFAAN